MSFPAKVNPARDPGDEKRENGPHCAELDKRRAASRRKGIRSRRISSFLATLSAPEQTAAWAWVVVHGGGGCVCVCVCAGVGGQGSAEGASRGWRGGMGRGATGLRPQALEEVQKGTMATEGRTRCTRTH
jgi:hypothetical protein